MTKFNIQYFAEGGEGGSVGSAEGPVAQGIAESSEPTVLYGKQEQTEPVAPEEGAEGAAEPPKRTFEELIKGEYKKDFDDRVQQILNKRFKEEGEKNERLTGLESLVSLVGEKYGTDAKDLKALEKAIMEDDSFFEAEAAERGMSVKDLKELKRMQMQNANLQAQVDRFSEEKEEAIRRQQADEEFQRIWEQGQELKKVYPEFDLNAEMQNEEFVKFLRMGISVQNAFEVIHRNELQPRAMEYVAKQTKETVAKSIQSGFNRPQENLQGSQAGIIVKSDPRKYTKKDFEEISERVRRGERIVY